MKQISIYDSTLRDGTQAQGIPSSVDDKIKSVERLDGVHYAAADDANMRSHLGDRLPALSG